MFQMRPTEFRRRLAPLGVALLAALLLAAPAAAARKGGQGTVAGTVTSLSGEPLAGVEITLAAGDGSSAMATTDKRGRFSVTVDAADYRVRLEKEGYAPFESPLTVEPGSQQVVTVELLDAAAGRRSEAAAAYNAAVRAYEAGDRAAARKGFEAAVVADPTLIEAHGLLAELHLEEGAWAEAAQAAERALAARPDDRQARLAAYEAYRRLGDEERSTALRRQLGEVSELAPQLAVQAFNEGAVAIEAGDAETAAARFDEALELDPGLAAAHFGRATLHYRAGRFDEALSALDEGLVAEPASVQGRRLGFVIHDAHGDRQAAAAAMDAYAEVDPGGAAGILFERAEAAFRDGDAEAAREGLTRVLEIQPDHAPAHHLLGLAYLTADSEAARRHLRRFLELAPEDPEAETVTEILGSLE